MIGISSTWLATKGLTIEESVNREFELGFDLVEIGAGHKYEDNAVETVLKLRNKHLTKSFTIHALFPPYKNGSSYPLNMADPDEHDRILKTVKGMFDISERLGSTFVGIHGGQAAKVKWGKEKFGFKYLKVMEEIDMEDAKTNMKIVLEDIIHIAKEKNMQLAVEISVDDDCREIMTNPEMFKWMFSMFKTKNLGILLDIGHVHRSSKNDGYDPYDFVKKIKDRVIEIHIHDCKGDNDHIAIGKGDIDFERYFSIIGKEKLESIPMVFEYNNSVDEKQALEGKKIIEKILENLN